MGYFRTSEEIIGTIISWFNMVKLNFVHDLYARIQLFDENCIVNLLSLTVLIFPRSTVKWSDENQQTASTQKTY